MNQPDPLQAVKNEIKAGRLSEAASKCLQLLRSDPTNINAIGLYGDLARSMGRREDALVIFGKLTQLVPEHPIANARLAELYYEHGDQEKAHQHANLALEANPESAEAHLVLGLVAMQAGREGEALPALEKARSLREDNEDVDAAFANALLYSGEFSRVESLSRDNIGRYPQSSNFHAILARSKKFQPGDPDVDLILGLLDEQGQLRAPFRATANLSVKAYMALFKLHSDLDRHEHAFDYLQRAKQIMKEGGASYYPDREADACEKFRDVFSADFVAAHREVGCQDDAPIFVVGMPRSGTTLLERVLARHQDISAAGELPLAGQLLAETCAQFGDNQHDIAALKLVPGAAWNEIGQHYLSRARRWAPEGKYFVDKMPTNYPLLGFIRTMLPRAKIIHISRHPVATCLSIYEQEFANTHPYANDLQWLGQHYLLYLQQMAQWRELYGDSLIEIDYESLVADQESASRWLWEQLELDDQTATIEQAQGDGIIRTPSAWQARQPVHTGSVARWESYRTQLQPLLQVLEPALETT